MKQTNTILKIVAICVICAATMISGCMETTTSTEYGEVTHNYITNETVVDIDMYVEGLHVTGTEVLGTSKNCNVDGYIDGNHVTGTMSQIGDGDPCYDWYMKVDYYQPDGYHVTGYGTLKGCGDDAEWYSVLTAAKDGYKTQYKTGYADAEWRT